MVLDGLIVKQPYADQIIRGYKKWEMRRRPPPIDKIGKNILLLSGGYALGIIRIVKVVGPLGERDLIRTMKMHGGANPTYRYAWVVKIVKKFEKPIKYRHPSGARVWVKNVKLAH
ncbi:MAG: ASCH domain-containing protein [Nitrososphaerota archaeon]